MNCILKCNRISTKLTKNIFKIQILNINTTKINTPENLLSRQLAQQIKINGPITLARFIKEALTHPSYGYYMKKDVFGEKGDFITSPDLSQLFGEMIALWFVNEYRKIGSPKSFQLIEFGPGRGTLCKDILRVWKRFNIQDLSVHLIETSPFLSKLQAKNLCKKSDRVENEIFYQSGITEDNIPIFWYNNIEDVPKMFSLIVANEFFDALPIHKLKKTENGWREILVDYENNDFKYVIARAPTIVSKIFEQTFFNEKRLEVEISLEAHKIIETISNRLEEVGGITLIIDYGHNGNKSDTFRAFKSHTQQHPLSNIGEADLTADVDFFQLIKVATNDEKLVAFGPVEQGLFLSRLGIGRRFEGLLKHTNDQNKQIIINNYNMLMHNMGEKFKLVALFPFVLKDFLNKFKPEGFS